MPTYVYACSNCGQQFEQFQSFKDDALTICPNCGQPQLRRVIQPAGIVFKGSGWYINDSRGTSTSTVTGDTSKTEKTEKSAKAETAADSATTSSTPAEKSEKSEKSDSAPASSEH